MAAQLGLALGEPARYEAVAPEQVRAPDAVRAGQLAAMFRFVHDFERVHCDAPSVACARELNPACRPSPRGSPPTGAASRAIERATSKGATP